MIIGLTGLNGSGKTSVANYFIKKGFRYDSLSNVIREQLESRGVRLTRENLIDEGNQLREEFGAGVLAKKIVERINYDGEFQTNIVIDSIRNPEEVEELRKLEGFYLISVEAPVRLRWEWVNSRKREGEEVSFEEFKKIEKVDGLTKNKKGQQVVLCQKKADIHVINNKSIEEFKLKLYDVLAEVRRRESVRTRQNLDNYFLKVVLVVAERSTCTRHHVGAIAVKDKHILSTGYNGAASGVKDCLELGCLRCKLRIPSGTRHEICRAIHAEQNVIIQSALHGVNLEGATIYCTHPPCILCAKMLVNAKIKEFVTFGNYPDKSGLGLFKEAGVKFRKLSKPSTRINVLD